MSENQNQNQISPKQKKLLDEILKDGHVSAGEFRKFMKEINADMVQTKAELKKATELYHKAMADNDRNIVAMAEINQSYAATVPAKVHTETMKDVTAKFAKVFKTLAYVVGISMLLFFLASYLPDLMNLVNQGTQYLLP